VARIKPNQLVSNIPSIFDQLLVHFGSKLSIKDDGSTNRDLLNKAIGQLSEIVGSKADFDLHIEEPGTTWVFYMNIIDHKIALERRNRQARGNTAFRE
jgi:hypothetical protein